MLVQAAAPGPEGGSGGGADAAQCAEHGRQFRLAAASRVAALGARQKACQKGLGHQEECDRVRRQGNKVGPLRHWAKRESRGWNRLAKAAEHFEAARRHARGQSFEACQADVELSLAYRLFPFEDLALEGQWQAGLTGDRLAFRPVQAELADVLTLSAECLLELAQESADAAQLLRAHIALVAASILRRQAGVAPDTGYLQTLQEQVSIDLSDVLEQTPLESLRPLARDVGLEHSPALWSSPAGLVKGIKKIVADGHIFRHITLETGKLAQGLHSAGGAQEPAQGAAGGAGAPSPNREVVVGQPRDMAWDTGSNLSLSFVPRWLVSPALGVVPPATILSLSPGCQQAGSGRECLSFFAPGDVSGGTARADEACEGLLEVAFEKWWAGVRAGEPPGSLDSMTENALVIALLEMGDDQYREVFPYVGSVELFGDFHFVADELTSGRGEEVEGRDGGGGKGAGEPEDSRQAQDRQMQEELLRRAQERLQANTNQDDYMVNVILLAIFTFSIFVWLCRKNRKQLQKLYRELQEDLNERGRRLDSNEVARLRSAMETADAVRLARVIEEVKYVDPAMLKRARSVLVQRRREEKAQEVAKSKAKAAKARGKATKAKAAKAREEKHNSAMLSTSAAVAATRARLQGESVHGNGGAAKDDLDGLSISDTSSDLTQEDFEKAFEDFQSVSSDSRLRRRKGGNHAGDGKRDGPSGGKHSSKAAQEGMQKSISQVIAALRRRPNMAGAMSHIGIPADARMRATYSAKPAPTQPAANPAVFPVPKARQVAHAGSGGGGGGGGGGGAASGGFFGHRPPSSTQPTARPATQHKAWDAPAASRPNGEAAPAPRLGAGEPAHDYVKMPYLSWMNGLSRRADSQQHHRPSSQPAPAPQGTLGATATAGPPVSLHVAAQQQQQTLGPGPIYADASFQAGRAAPAMSAMAEPFHAPPALAPVMPPVMGATATAPSAGLLSAVWAASEKGHHRSKSSDWSAAANHLAAVNDARRAQLQGGEPLLDSGEWLAESLLAEIR